MTINEALKSSNEEAINGAYRHLYGEGWTVFEIIKRQIDLVEKHTWEEVRDIPIDEIKKEGYRIVHLLPNLTQHPGWRKAYVYFMCFVVYLPFIGECRCSLTECAPISLAIQRSHVKEQIEQIKAQL